MDSGIDATKLKFLIRDRAGQFTGAFRRGVRRRRPSGPQEPTAGPESERTRRELLDRMLILNEQHLRRTLTRYLQHYNTA
jgi:hypothetical protein